MTNTAISIKEADKVIEFICETKNGKYSAEKPDLISITYARLEIQDTSSIFDECFEDNILYGISY